MATFTFNDFQKAAKSAGMENGFSAADLALAKENPDAGMSILQYKKDWQNATTDEARALANEGANSIRSSYGSYSGGSDGSGYYKTQLSPSSYTASTAPTYSSSYDDELSGLAQQVANREDFSYDADTDPLYSQYVKQYTREGQRATQNALGDAAAASGGIPSSYALTAATQAGDYYAAQMTDKIPELQQIAYNQYVQNHSLDLADLSALQSEENRKYGQYQDELAQYNTDRNFDYNQILDEINSQSAQRSEARQAEQDALNKALSAADLGDYSLLSDLNINASNNPTEWERKYTLAKLAASFGDLSGLKALNIDTSAYEA